MPTLALYPLATVTFQHNSGTELECVVIANTIVILVIKQQKRVEEIANDEEINQ